MQESYSLEKLTRCPWVNLFCVKYNHKSETSRTWMMCSRKPQPIQEASQADAVVIVPFIETTGGRRLVVTKEFRVPLWDYEYGFPAGLIDDGESMDTAIARELKEETGLDLLKINHISMPVFSSGGLTDESCVMAMVEARGDVSTQGQEETEDIEVIFMDVSDVQALLASGQKVSAKAWGLFYHISQTGRIE
ncbi:MAG: NUDIX hydrolase [Planctomycetes bacterium]|nr:NUDIX hydrolase [Planctomycetota bacterium]